MSVNWQDQAAVLASYKLSTRCHFVKTKEVKGSDLPIARAQFTYEHILCSLLEMIAFDVLTESLSIRVNWWFTTTLSIREYYW